MGVKSIFQIRALPADARRRNKTGKARNGMGSATAQKPKLLDRLRNTCRLRPRIKPLKRSEGLLLGAVDMRVG